MLVPGGWLHIYTQRYISVCLWLVSSHAQRTQAKQTVYALLHIRLASTTSLQCVKPKWFHCVIRWSTLAKPRDFYAISGYSIRQERVNLNHLLCNGIQYILCVMEMNFSRNGLLNAASSNIRENGEMHYVQQKGKYDL